MNRSSTASQIRVHTTTLRSGIQPSPKFAKKGLAIYAVNVGRKCGHDCLLLHRQRLARHLHQHEQPPLPFARTPCRVNRRKP
jgi:hypothetical protein